MSERDDRADLAGIVKEAAGKSELLQVTVDGPWVVVSMGARAIRESRRTLLTVCLLGTVGGLILARFNWMGWLVAAVSVAAALIVPRWLKRKPLFEFDSESGSIILLQNSAARGTRLPQERIQRIRGRFTTQGWDGFSQLDAILDDGAEITVVSFSGTNDDIAEHACELLGKLLACPASYTPSFGDEVVCYEPGSMSAAH
jgi:hypothetical protein